MKLILKVAGVSAGAGSVLAGGLLNAEPVKKPNIVMFLVDDLGRNDLGCYGSKFYETPNIDKLAAEGIMFTDAYSAHPVCSPTRAALMTGKNPCRSSVNITDWIKGERRKHEKLLGPEFNFDLPLKEFTIAEALKEGGYATWFIGKWHLGETEKHWPRAQGFDINIGGYFKGSPRSYYSPYKNPMLKDGPKGEYLTDRLASEAINLIKNRDKDDPFFLYLSFYAIHAPIVGCRRYMQKFQKKAEALPELEKNFRVDHRGKTRLRQDSPRYASMMYALDENVGRVIDELKKEGILNNTVIFFTGDNGSLTTTQRGPGPTCALPLRTGKGWCYEGGVRVPFIVWDPFSDNHGVQSSVPVINTDFYATVLDYAKLPQRPEQALDSTDIRPLIEGKVSSLKPVTPMVWHYPHYHGSGWVPGSAIRDGDWKLVQSYHDGTVELYNLKDDLGEQHDVSKQYPEKTKELLKKMHDYLDSVGAKMPKPNPNPGKRKRKKRKHTEKKKQQ